MLKKTEPSKKWLNKHIRTRKDIFMFFVKPILPPAHLTIIYDFNIKLITKENFDKTIESNKLISVNDKDRIEDVIDRKINGSKKILIK